MKDGGRVTATGETIVDSGGPGVQVTGVGTTASLVSCSIRSGAAAGILVEAGGSGTLTACTMSANDVGAEAGGEGTRIDCVKCEITESDSAGVAVLEGASAALSECTLSANEDGAYIDTAGRVEMSGCRFVEQFDDGIEAISGVVNITGCLFDGNAYAINAGASARLAVLDSEFWRNEHQLLAAVGAEIVQKDNLFDSPEEVEWGLPDSSP